MLKSALILFFVGMTVLIIGSHLISGINDAVGIDFGKTSSQYSEGVKFLNDGAKEIKRMGGIDNVFKP